MKILTFAALSFVPLLLTDCGQQLVEFRNPPGNTPDAGITDGIVEDGERAELIIDTETSGGRAHDAAGDDTTVDTMVAGFASREAGAKASKSETRVGDVPIVGVPDDFEEQPTHLQRNYP